jgi:hypothetical protein
MQYAGTEATGFICWNLIDSCTCWLAGKETQVREAVNEEQG